MFGVGCSMFNLFLVLLYSEFYRHVICPFADNNRILLNTGDGQFLKRISFPQDLSVYDRDSLLGVFRPRNSLHFEAIVI
jgi:hypothetical protein